MTHLNGYYMDGKRLAHVCSFHEGIRALYFDSLASGISMANAPVRLPHTSAPRFKPITLAQALATGLNETQAYVDQVRRGQFVRRLMDEPKIVLLLVDPSSFRPEMDKGDVWPKGIGTLPEAHNADKCRIWFRASFSYFDDQQDEERTYQTDWASVCLPRSLIDSFTPKAYAKWVKGELAAKRERLVKHVNERVAQAKAILP